MFVNFCRLSSEFEAEMTSLDGCSGSDVDAVLNVKKMLEDMISFIGMCSMEPYIRQCKPYVAQECVYKLTHLAIQNWQHEYFVCS